MDRALFRAEVEALQEKIEELKRCSSGSSHPRSELLANLLDELQISLELLETSRDEQGNFTSEEAKEERHDSGEENCLRSAEAKSELEIEVHTGTKELVRENQTLKRANEVLQARIEEHKRIEGLLRLQRDLALALSSSKSMKEALGQIFEAALKVESIDAGAVYLVNDAGWVEMIMHRGLSPRFVEGCARCAPDSPRASIVRAGAWLYRDSAYIARSQFEDLREEGLRALADFPVKCGGKASAAIILASRTTTRSLPAPAWPWNPWRHLSRASSPGSGPRRR